MRIFYACSIIAKNENLGTFNVMLLFYPSPSGRESPNVGASENVGFKGFGIKHTFPKTKF
jgi:hypothetical protein